MTFTFWFLSWAEARQPVVFSKRYYASSSKNQAIFMQTPPTPPILRQVHLVKEWDSREKHLASSRAGKRKRIDILESGRRLYRGQHPWGYGKVKAGKHSVSQWGAGGPESRARVRNSGLQPGVGWRRPMGLRPAPSSPRLPAPPERHPSLTGASHFPPPANTTTSTTQLHRALLAPSPGSFA